MRRQPDERAHLNVIRANRELAATERPSAVDGELIRANALDLRAECDQEVAQVLHVRLASGVAQGGRPSGSHSRCDRVFGAGDAWLIQKHVGAAQLRRRQVKALRQLIGRAASAAATPRSTSARRYSTAAAIVSPSSWSTAAPASW